jgi:hypothetical protein
VKLTIHFHLVQRSKNEWSYTSTPPIRLHGVVFSQKEAQGQLYLYLYLKTYSWHGTYLNYFFTYMVTKKDVSAEIFLQKWGKKNL